MAGPWPGCVYEDPPKYHAHLPMELHGRLLVYLIGYITELFSEYYGPITSGVLPAGNCLLPAGVRGTSAAFSRR